jgi:hypothetical protein
MVEDLLVGFVGHDWIHELDFSTLEKLNNSYITDEFRERSDDIIWRVRFRDQWLYVYLLIEFQSSVDHTMPVRLLSYIGALYQDLIASKKISAPKKLPPGLPIVLYHVFLNAAVNCAGQRRRPWGKCSNPFRNRYEPFSRNCVID